MPKGAYEVEFSDGTVHYVHAPGISGGGLNMFLKALPALAAIGKAFEGLDVAAQGIQGIQPELPDEVIEQILPLLALMTDLTIEEFRALSVWDFMGVIVAFSQFAPKNLAAAKAE